VSNFTIFVHGELLVEISIIALDSSDLSIMHIGDWNKALLGSYILEETLSNSCTSASNHVLVNGAVTTNTTFNIKTSAFSTVFEGNAILLMFHVIIANIGAFDRELLVGISSTSCVVSEAFRCSQRFVC